MDAWGLAGLFSPVFGGRGHSANSLPVKVRATSGHGNRSMIGKRDGCDRLYSSPTRPAGRRVADGCGRASGPVQRRVHPNCNDVVVKLLTIKADARSVETWQEWGCEFGSMRQSNILNGDGAYA
jgi:hypothetical protein